MGNCADCGVEMEPRTGPGHPFSRCEKCRSEVRRRSTRASSKESVCVDCGQVFTIARKDGVKRLQGPTRCPTCSASKKRERQYAWREANPEKWKAIYDRSSAKQLADPEFRRRKREAEVRRNYGIDRVTYGLMLTAQSGVCAICGLSPQGKANGGARPDHQPNLHVDHDHVTGRVRGLLCGKCNTMLGLADENPAVLVSALKYLNRSPL